MLAKNMIEPAGLIFKFILEKSPGNLLAQLGQACFNFLSGNFRSALQGFQTILRSHPEFNEIRAAIGYCFQRLGFKEMAQKAFQRVLSLDPQNEAALLAIGFLQLDSSKSPQDLQNGLLQMKNVFELNRSNAVAQIHLANHFFFKKEFSKAKTLSEGALNHAPSDKIKAEAYFILAKISHVNGNFSDALGNYQLATKLAPDFLPALFGLGQCFLARGDMDGAIMLFEKVLESEPNCPEVLRLLVLINASKIAKMPESEASELIKKTLNYLNRALKVFPDDLLLLKCAAVFLESSDPEKSVKFYTASNAEESDNFAVLNNFVVLKQSLKLSNEAVDPALLRRSQSLASDTLMRTFVKFNEARLLEEFEGLISRAEEIYKEIILDNPSFPLAHLRLGAICFTRSQYAEAADHFKDVLGADEQNRDAWNCVAATHLKQKAFTPARKSFERVLQNIDKNDPYALVSLGNIYIELARQDKSSKHSDEYHRRAGDFYGKALSLDRGNLYAAQGIGLIFADRGLSAEAREIFTQVRASAALKASDQDSTLNLAHSLTELGKYPAAVTLYASVIEAPDYAALSAAKRVSLLLYLCRARYLLALEAADFGAADLAIEDTHKALGLLPSDDPLKFNLGLLLQARAQAIRDSKNDSITRDLLNSAIQSVKEAGAIFSNEFKNFDQKLILSRVSMCPGLIKGIQERAELNDKSVKDQTDRLDQLKLQREAQALKDAEEQVLKGEKERLRLAEIEKNRRELAQKMKETDEKVKAASYQQRSSTQKKTGDSDSESDAEPEASKRKKRVKTASDTEKDEDELDGITGAGRRRGKRSNSTATGPLLSKEFISSDEEEDEKAPMSPMEY